MHQLHCAHLKDTGLSLLPQCNRSCFSTVVLVYINQSSFSSSRLNSILPESSSALPSASLIFSRHWYSAARCSGKCNTNEPYHTQFLEHFFSYDLWGCITANLSLNFLIFQGFSRVVCPQYAMAFLFQFQEPSIFLAKATQVFLKLCGYVYISRIIIGKQDSILY